jgi:hypothetical protein
VTGLVSRMYERCDGDANAGSDGRGVVSDTLTTAKRVNLAYLGFVRSVASGSGRAR